jgi:hypothetical protein
MRLPRGLFLKLDAMVKVSGVQQIRHPTTMALVRSLHEPGQLRYAAGSSAKLRPMAHADPGHAERRAPALLEHPLDF